MSSRPSPVVIDNCPVCPDAVEHDPANPRQPIGDRPVRMPDRRYTHEKCKSRYWQAIERLAAIHSAEAGDWLDDSNRDYLGSADSAQSRYAEQVRDGVRRDPPRVTFGGAA